MKQYIINLINNIININKYINIVLLLLILINYKICESRSEELSVCPYVACVSVCVRACKKQFRFDQDGFKKPANIVRNVEWAGRVTCEEDERHTQSCDRKPEGKVPLGRPRYRREDDVKTTLG